MAPRGDYLELNAGTIHALNPEHSLFLGLYAGTIRKTQEQFLSPIKNISPFLGLHVGTILVLKAFCRDDLEQNAGTIPESNPEHFLFLGLYAGTIRKER